MQTYKNLTVSRLSDEMRARTAGHYWYVVQEGCSAHTAFARREHLDAWLNRLGLALDSPLSDNEPGSSRIIGTYSEQMCLSDVDQSAFHTLQGAEDVPWLSNGDYTLGKIVTAEDGLRTVWYLNPNVRDRHVFDYAKARALVG